MSYEFSVGSRTVWSPSLQTGQIYVGYIRSLENLLGVSAGFEPSASDMVRVNRDQFSTFVDALLDWYRPSDPRNVQFRSQMFVVLGPAVVMLDRSGTIEIDVPEELLTEARNIPMPS